MSNSVLVEGPLPELTQLRERISLDYQEHVLVSKISEREDNILDPGSLGDSPLASFLIQFSADLSAAGVVATIAAIKGLVVKRGGKAKIKEVESANERD